MDDAALTQYIIEQLGKHASRDNLIFDICSRTGLDWNHVSDLVVQVEQTHQQKIAMRQSPLLLIIAFGIFVGGLWAIGGAVIYFLGLAQRGSFSLDPFALRRDYLTIIRLGTGLLMVCGSIIGTFRIIGSMLPKSR